MTKYFICETCEDKTPIKDKSTEYKKHDICVYCAEYDYSYHTGFNIEEKDK